MKFVKLTNGNVIIKDDEDKILRSLTSDRDVCIGGSGANQIMLMKGTSIFEFKVSDIKMVVGSDDTETDTSEYTIEELITELATNFFLKASTGGGGTGGSNNASDLTTGTLPDGRLSNNIPRKTEFKTINNESVIGEGNIHIEGGAPTTNAADLSSGTLSDDRLSDNVIFKDEISGNERQVLGYAANGNPTPLRLGWKQLSDLPSPPPFSNGVLTGTAFQSDGSALFAFLELALGTPKSGTLPTYNLEGTLSTEAGTVTKDAINFGQLTTLKNELNLAISSKIDDIDGMGLSQTSFTEAEKTKLASIIDHYAGRFTSLTDLETVVGASGNYAYVSIDGAPIVIYVWNGQTSEWESSVLAAGEESPESIKAKYETVANSFTDAEKAKLLAIVAGATKNQSDSYLTDLANQTGSLALSKVTGLALIIQNINAAYDALNLALGNKEDKFSKGSIIQGRNVTIEGNLSNRLVGSGDITINVNSEESGSLDSLIESPVYFWDYHAAPLNSVNFGIGIAALATIAYVSGDAKRAGVANITSTNTGGSGANSMLFNSTTAMILSGGEVHRASFKVNQLSTANTAARAGFMDTSGSGVVSNGAFLAYQSVAKTLSAVTVKAGVASAFNFSTTFNPNQWLTSIITVNSDATSVKFEVYDENKVLLFTHDATTNIPTVSLGAGINAYGAGGISGVILNLDYQAVKMGSFPNR